MTKLSSTPSPSPSGSEPILQELQIIEQQIRNPPKDFWDKLNAISALLGGLLVAAIGAVATYVFNQRQREADDKRATQVQDAEDARKAHELTITRIQTLQAFLPQLKSSDERDKEAAILAITSLGDNALMERVATLYRGAGVVKALATVATGEPGAAQIAMRALGEILNSLERAVVRIKVQLEGSGIGVASGFVAADGRIISVTYVLDEHHSNSLQVQFWDGIATNATVVARDDAHMLMVLAADTRGITPLVIESDEIQSSSIENSLIDPTIIVLSYPYGSDRDVVSIGNILGLTEGQPGLATGPLLVASLNTTAGSSGAPVVNTRGRVIGVSHGTRDNRKFLIPAPPIARILAQVQT